MLLFAGLIGLFPKNLPRKKKMVEGETDYENCDRDGKAAEKLEYMDEDVQLKSIYYIFNIIRLQFTISI